jgi:hypothetical protein
VLTAKKQLKNVQCKYLCHVFNFREKTKKWISILGFQAQQASAKYVQKLPLASN